MGKEDLMLENSTKSCYCSDCTQVNPQPITNFSKDKRSKDGLQSRCKSCDRAYYEANREEKIAYVKTYRIKNPEKKRIWDATYSERNEEKEALRKVSYQKNNPGKVNAKTARHRAKKLKATPKSLTKTHRKQIQSIYDEAARLTRETGIPHEVDHIIPLQGESVSGLHVPWNLQILTDSENGKKKNRFDFTYNNESWKYA